MSYTPFILGMIGGCAGAAFFSVQTALLDRIARHYHRPPKPRAATFEEEIEEAIEAAEKPPEPPPVLVPAWGATTPDAQADEVRMACFALIADAIRNGSGVRQYDIPNVHADGIPLGAFEIRVVGLDMKIEMPFPSRN